MEEKVLDTEIKRETKTQKTKKVKTQQEQVEPQTNQVADKATDKATFTPFDVVIVPAAVNCRKGPSISHQVEMIVKKNQRYKAIDMVTDENKEKWVKLGKSHGLIKLEKAHGWVMFKHVKRSK